MVVFRNFHKYARVRVVISNRVVFLVIFLLTGYPDRSILNLPTISHLESPSELDLARQGIYEVHFAEAGVLKGKKYAFQRDPLKTTEVFKTTDPRFAGGIYSGQGVVQDGKIITSGICAYIEKAQGIQNVTVPLTQAFISELRPR